MPPNLDRQIAAALRRAAFPPGAALIVAASGGPDSTALLRALHRLAPNFRLRLHVAHLNHDFRGAEADHDAAFVQQLADRLGLPASIDQQDPIAYQKQRRLSSFEQAAREMRYAFLYAVAQSARAPAIALGHTADDQAETVLMHLLRGAGPQGLRGMSQLTPWPWPQPHTQPAPQLFRPLLTATKADTAAYCQTLYQPYRQDSGNYMWRFTRNKIRHDLIPNLTRNYNPRIRQALTRLSRAAAADCDYIQTQLNRHWPTIAQETPHQITFNINALTSLHPALQRQALRRAALTITADAPDPLRLRETHIESMLDLLHNPQGGRAINLPQGITARRQNNTIQLTRQAAKPSLPPLNGDHPIPIPQNPAETIQTNADGWRITIQTIPSNHPVTIQTIPPNPPISHESPYPPNPAPPNHPQPPYTAQLDRNALGNAAILRTRRPGDRFQPNGMTGTKKLQDYFTDAKIPRQQRDHIPLLATPRGIAWIAGHRTAQWATPRKNHPTLQITLTPPPNP